MIREANAMTVRQNLGELINEVRYRHNAVLITKSGKPVAAMVDVELFEKIRAMREDFERLCAEIGNAFKGVSQEQRLAAAEEAAARAHLLPQKPQ